MTTTTNDKLGAYDTHQRNTHNNRDTDKLALLTIAGKLKAALDDGGKNMKLYEDAIRLNQKLWTIFQVSLCDPENQLPRQTKNELLSLSKYVDRISFAAITNFAPHALTSLIEINRMIATGLGKKAASSQQREATSMPPQPTEPMSLMISA